MKKLLFTVGVDIASDSFTATIVDAYLQSVGMQDDIPNNPEGYSQFCTWLTQYNISSENSIICMEATGVYGEQLCYYLVSNQFRVAVEQPLKIKRSSKFPDHKTDLIDSRKIAVYAHRHYDELSFWQPNTELIEQIKTLFSSRELIVKQCVSNKNALHSITRKHYRTPFAEKAHIALIAQLQKRIDDIEAEIKRLIDQDSLLRATTALLVGIPGVGFVIATSLLCLTNGFTRQITAKQLAAYAGICPYECTSGKSIRKKPRSKRCGPSSLRKLLHLAARSVRTHNKLYRHYYYRKLNEGKPKRLVFNNIANKLVKVICAVLNSQIQYIPDFKSVNPIFLK